MTDRPLLAVAHGSRDPRSAASVCALVDEVRRQHPDLDVRLCFLELSAPRLPDVLAAVHADGHRQAVIVPLLLGQAYHAGVDVPGAVRRAARRHPGMEIAVARILGDRGGRRGSVLDRVALHRLAEVAGPLHDPGLGVVLAAAGSSHAPANAAVAATVQRWSRRYGWSGGTAAFATATGPTVDAAITRLRAGGARRIAVARWFLAPGLLSDRVAQAARGADPAVAVAGPLGADGHVAALVVDRYRAAPPAGREARRAG